MDTDGANYGKIIRLLCLQSLTAGGIRTSKYESIKRLLVQCYGYDQTFTLSNLEKAGYFLLLDFLYFYFVLLFFSSEVFSYHR
jgi:hypothetical protein